MENYFDANLQSWNTRTAIHLNSKFYDVEGWLTHKNSLMAIEKAVLGDLHGKSVLHLQCHFGQDTLSLAHMGAKVTGVDFSDEAIRAAKDLAHRAGLEAEFICCNVYDTLQHLDKQYDLVFTTYGTIGWLPDLKPWAKVVSGALKPGGRFLIVDFHPVLWMMNDEMTALQYPYLNTEVIESVQSGSYTDGGKDVPLRDFSWNHGLSEIMSPLIAEGLQLTQFQEFTYSPYACFPNSVQGPDGNYRIIGLEDKLPTVYLMDWKYS
jgi:2-polyprenyl-3-methyl-5-hydroxy-6-metoxy-1,4-benzoquinol methylase